MPKKGRLRVGCSGWRYPHWKGDFYPLNLPESRWLAHYATRFDTVEINNSFYRLPEEETFAKWKAETPSGFLFSVKASRYLTHMKKLKDPEEPLSLFFERAGALGKKLGPVLYQLPPRRAPDLGRLREFLQALPARRRHVLELRDPRWYGEAVLRELEKTKVVLCLHDMPGSSSPLRVTGAFVYVRFHGAGAKYGGRYPDGQLGGWAEWLEEEIQRGRDVYLYFNNDAGGHAPRDAIRLRERLRSRV